MSLCLHMSRVLLSGRILCNSLLSITVCNYVWQVIIFFLSLFQSLIFDAEAFERLLYNSDASAGRIKKSDMNLIACRLVNFL